MQSFFDVKNQGGPSGLKKWSPENCLGRSGRRWSPVLGASPQRWITSQRARPRRWWWLVNQVGQKNSIWVVRLWYRMHSAEIPRAQNWRSLPPRSSQAFFREAHFWLLGPISFPRGQVEKSLFQKKCSPDIPLHSSPNKLFWEITLKVSFLASKVANPPGFTFWAHWDNLFVSLVTLIKVVNRQPESEEAAEHFFKIGMLRDEVGLAFS